MEESAPKRRRISPRTSVAIHASESQPPASTTPARPARAKRPSFASPTKSSLARSNPEVLERRASSRREREHASPVRGASQAPDDTQYPHESAPAAGPAETAETAPSATDSDIQPQLSRRPKRRSGRDLLADAIRAREQAERTHSPAPQPSHDSNPSPVNTPSRGGTRRFEGGMGALPRRSPVKPIPRPLPQPGGSPEEDINPFAGRVLKRTPPGGRPSEPETGRQVPEIPEPELEAELPPTPTQLGRDDPVVTSPAQGIHDTPSFRSKRRSSHGLKPSPLKAPPLRPPDLDRPERDPAKGKGKSPARRARVSDRDLVIEIGDEDDDNEDDDDDVSVDIDDPATGPHPARRLAPFDSLPEKAAQLEKIRAEAEQLEADLALAMQENARVHDAQSRRRSAKQMLEPPPNPEAVIDLLRRHFLPTNQVFAPDLSAQLFSAAMEPTSWFSLRPPAGPVLNTQDEVPTPVSHHPVQMSVEEQLPFLQAFTPFKVSSSTLMQPREELDGPLFRQHNISVSSASPPGLFAAKIEMTVNTDTLRVAELRVPRLDPASIAELGPFVEKQCAGKRNISIMCWAMAEWYRIAVERARFWCELEQQVRTKEKLAELVREARMSRRRKKRRRDEEDDEDPSATGGGAAEPITRGAIMAHMGRTSFEISIPEDGEDEAKWPRLRIQWRIDFDWTGEGQSKVGVMIGVPGKWHDNDDGGALPSIQKVFAGLVKGERNPSTAVRTVIALLVGDMPSARE